MTLPYPNAQRVHWDLVRKSGSDIEITLKNNTFTTVTIEQMRQLLHYDGLTADDVRAIVRDEIGKRA